MTLKRLDYIDAQGRFKNRANARDYKEKKVKEDLSQERLQQMMVIIPEQGIHVKALQTKYPIIDWEIYTEGIRQYWKIIKGNSFKPVAQTIEGSSTPHIPGPMTADEKIQKKNDVKARSMLLMALLNEHMMTFNQYNYAKSLFDAITTRFGGNDATRKTQKTLLKQIYENFSAQSTESL
nr:hypothetical protein [Tanacetum cinerariifolium]